MILLSSLWPEGLRGSPRSSKSSKEGEKEHAFHDAEVRFDSVGFPRAVLGRMFRLRETIRATCNLWLLDLRCRIDGQFGVSDVRVTHHRREDTFEVLRVENDAGLEPQRARAS